MSATFNDWLRFQEFAKDNGFDSLEFMAAFPSGLFKCRWLDAYMGLIRIDGMDGFVMVRDLDKQFPGTVCIVLSDAEAA